MNKISLFIIAMLAAVSAQAIDSVVIQTALPDNRIISKTIKTQKVADGVSKVVIKAEEIDKDCKYFDVLADNAVAKKGEAGFWIFNRGLLGYFNKDNGRYYAHKNYMYLPYYAMKTPRETFIAIIDGMRFEFAVHVEATNGSYKMYPRWFVDKIGTAPYEDITITFYTLPADADYNQMAKTYRKHKFERNHDILPMKKRFATQPELEKMAKSLPIRMGFSRKPFDREKDSVNFYPRGGKPFRDEKYGINAEREEYAPKGRKFSMGITQLDEIKAYGIDDLAVCITGWQTGGDDARLPTIFPVSPEAGGENALKQLIQYGKKLGYVMDGHDNYTDAFTCSPDWSPDNISKSPDGKLERNGAWTGGIAYNLCLVNAWEKFIPSDIERTAKLGFRGAHYVDVFTAVAPYRCFDPKHAGNRKQVGEVQKKIALMYREKFGGFASECGFDHIIGQVDYVNYVCAPMRAKYVYKQKSMQFVDKFVPFWELVYHDVVLHTTDKITQEVLTQENNLRLIEFGGRPIFYGVGLWNLAEVRKAYDQFKKLRHLLVEEMLSHKELAENVFEIKYGDGSTVVVNRTQKAFYYDGEKVCAMNYRLFNPPLWRKAKNLLEKLRND